MPAADRPPAPGIRPEALPAWRLLCDVLDGLADAGRRTACQSDPEAFTAERPTQRDEAAAACAHCPALIPCAAFAEANTEVVFVWGGRDREPRRTQRKETADARV